MNYLLSLTVVLSLAASVSADDFKTATRDPYNRPPTKSLNGKSIAEMKAGVEKVWDSFVFEKDGKPVEYIVEFQTDIGKIVMEFYPDVAPNHVRSFLALSKVGFYEGTIFHRCIPGFVIQGGCPIGNGTGGPGYCVKAEFNKRPHVRGVLSMARAQPNDSAGSQFFVCVANTPALDNKYTVFGHVTQGMDVVDRIVSAQTDSRDKPLNPVKVNKVSIMVK